MTVDLVKARNIALDNTVYTVESYDIHNNIRYANAYRKVGYRLIEVQAFEIRKELGCRL